MIGNSLIDFPIPSFLRTLTPRKEIPKLLYYTSHSGSASSVTQDEITCGSWAHTETTFLHQWIREKPEDHFDCHFNPHSRMPTMFISTTPEFLRAVQLAVKRDHEGHQNIKITVIDARQALNSYHDVTNAGIIAQKLERDDARWLNSEWVFLGRIKADAIVHQIDFTPDLCQTLFNYFPTFRSYFRLGKLRTIIPGDFDQYDQYLFDQTNKACDDARRCSLLTNNLGPWLRKEKCGVYVLLIEAIKSWKQQVFTEEQERDFRDIVNLYAPSISCD